VKAGKLYSKHWTLREDALKTISQTLCETEETAGRDVTLLLLRGAIVAFNRAVRDNVFAVRVHRHRHDYYYYYVLLYYVITHYIIYYCCIYNTCSTANDSCNSVASSYMNS